ncbi:glycosyl hydrolase family 79 C-terminal domain-containing protein [Yinghuangia sp. ASG 101]|uniref:glycosyl hydrolase family 79 C-terminal domain-containing protein n=1 Tax=Yinghuangia sp. ASG 101 TaxID=2896848 RepID=UPI001E518877|nr:glycosyl hydrolase family 79 C-terminal domain-containing protein [Yinghuangia sp. ASG 101]UGQ11165.1 glycosyl hydrolase family 79 C-terminal domain-containing protein [Yinghuangia sp. ASG 101]
MTIDASGKGGPSIPEDFLGLSIGVQTLHEPWVSTDHGNLARLLGNLGRSSMRFAANGADETAWQPDPSVPPPPWANGQVITPADLARAGALARSVQWSIDLGVNLAHDDPAAAADLAASGQRHLGPLLRSIQLGNEPNLFETYRGIPGYTPDAYVKQATTYVDAINKSAPGVPLSGPDAAGFLWGVPQADPLTKPIPSWWSAYVNAFGRTTRFLDQHYYPLVNSPNIETPATIDNMLSPAIVANTKDFLELFARQARAAGLPAHLSETNNVANGGKEGVSNTFAAALWTVDYALTAANAGISGMNFHQSPKKCYGYTWLCLPDQNAETAGRLQAQPSYYAGLLVSTLRGGRFLPARVSGTSANVTAYALRMPDGKIRVVINNLDKNLKGSVAVKIKGGDALKATLQRLEGPSLDATSGVRFAGSQVAADGSFIPAKPHRLPVTRDTVHVPLTTPTAILLDIGGRRR